MIKFYSGTPGSGKSLNSARAIYNNLFIYKSDVIANFPINEEVYNKKKKKGRFDCIPNNQLSAKVLMDISYERGYFGKESQCLVVIDEASLIFNSRNWNSPGRMDWLELFNLHRKFGYDFIIISQFSGQIDKQIRQVFEYEIIHRKYNNYGFMRYFPINLFLVIERSAQFKMKNSVSTFLYSKKHAKLYDTFHDFRENQKLTNS